MIWPQSGDSVDLLTMEEKMRGMEVLAETTRGLRTALCLGVQGRDVQEMLVYARHAEKLAPAAIISRPPDTARTEDDLRQYWRALAEVTKRPLIFQTTGGVAYKGPVSSVKLMVELTKEFAQFGYIRMKSVRQCFHPAADEPRDAQSLRWRGNFLCHLREGVERLRRRRSAANRPRRARSSARPARTTKNEIVESSGRTARRDPG